MTGEVILIPWEMAAVLSARPARRRSGRDSSMTREAARRVPSAAGGT